MACNTLNAQLGMLEAHWDNIEKRTEGQYEMEKTLDQPPSTAAPTRNPVTGLTGHWSAMNPFAAFLL